jgi:isopentenyl phosphate kinase
MDRELVLVKLGGSVITDKTKPFSERRDVIARLAAEIHSSHVEMGIRLIIGHGGGSYPHVPAQKYLTHIGLTDENSRMGAALVQDAASRLNRIVVDALLKAGESAVSVQPSSSAVARDSKIVSWDLGALTYMLEVGLVPVPYGDVGMDLVKGFCILSTEEVFRYLSVKLKPSRVIIGSDVDGVYNEDPRKNERARKIPLITLENASKVLPSLGGATTVDVTGGMRSKVLTLLELVKEVDIECEILNLLIPGNLEDALNGERGRGTLIRRSES